MSDEQKKKPAARRTPPASSPAVKSAAAAMEAPPRASAERAAPAVAPSGGSGSGSGGKRASHAPSLPPFDAVQLARLIGGEHSDPHSLLGAHPATVDGANGAVVRVMHPDAASAECLVEGGTTVAMQQVAHGVFSCFVPGATVPLKYRVRFHFHGGATWE